MHRSMSLKYASANASAKEAAGSVQVFFFFFTLVTGPRRSVRLTLSDTRVYEPQIRARLGTTIASYYVFFTKPRGLRAGLDIHPRGGAVSAGPGNPSTLDPESSDSNPEPSTVNREPSTRTPPYRRAPRSLKRSAWRWRARTVPAPCTLHTAHCTLHPAPCTLHPEPHTPIQRARALRSRRSPRTWRARRRP